MPEVGSYYERFSKVDEVDEDDASKGIEDRETLIEQASEALSAAEGNMPAELLEQLQQINDTADTYFEKDPEVAATIIAKVAELAADFAGITDESEIEERAVEAADDIDSLEKKTRILTKDNKVH